MTEDNKGELILDDFKIIKTNTFKGLIIKYGNEDISDIDLNKVQSISFVYDGFIIFSKEKKDTLFVFYDILRD